MGVKRNQPTLYQAIELAFAALPPINQAEAAFWQFQSHITTDKAHGRLERRTLQSTPAFNDYLEWPGVAQVCAALVSVPNSRAANPAHMSVSP